MVKVCIGHTRSFLYDKGEVLHRVCKTLPIYRGMLHCIMICYFCTLSPLYIQEKFCVPLRKASLIHIIYCSCHIKAVEFFNQSYWIHSHHITLLVINSLGDGDTRTHTYKKPGLQPAHSWLKNSCVWITRWNGSVINMRIACMSIVLFYPCILASEIFHL